jgi:hypothetical protein
MRLGVCALAAFVFLPVSSRADSPSASAATGVTGYYDCRPSGWQGVNHGSYSPLHYWVPRLYTYRAYHRSGTSLEQYPSGVLTHDAGPGDKGLKSEIPSPKPEKIPAPKRIGVEPEEPKK